MGPALKLLGAAGYTQRGAFDHAGSAGAPGRFGVDGDVDIGYELSDRLFDCLRQVVDTAEALVAVDQDVQVDEELRAGVAEADAMTVGHAGNGFHGRNNLLFQAFGGAVHQDGDRAQPQFDAHLNNDGRDEDGRDGIGVVQRFEARHAIADNDADQTDDDHRGTPDVGAEVQSIRFQGMAPVLAGGTVEHARPRDIDDDRRGHDRKRPERYLDLHLLVNQAIGRGDDDPDARAQQQQGFEKRGEILDLAVAVGVRPVGRLGGDAYGQPGHDRSQEVKCGMRRFRQDTQATGGKTDKDLYTGQEDRPEDGTLGGVGLLTMGVVDGSGLACWILYGGRQRFCSLPEYPGHEHNADCRHDVAFQQDRTTHG